MVYCQHFPRGQGCVSGRVNGTYCCCYCAFDVLSSVTSLSLMVVPKILYRMDCEDENVEPQATRWSHGLCCVQDSPRQCRSLDRTPFNHHGMGSGGFKDMYVMLFGWGNCLERQQSHEFMRHDFFRTTSFCCSPITPALS